MAYTTIDDPTIYFNTILYTGDGNTRSLTGVGFQPDWVWAKERNGTNSNNFWDSVRGATKGIFSDQTTAELTNAGSGYLTSFDSDGFSVQAGSGSIDNLNRSSGTYVAWSWLAANGTASNSDGSITSTVSANTTAGFSIVSYTGNGTQGATIGHGLGIKPSWILVKRRDNTSDWLNYHSSLGATKSIFLNATHASGTYNYWNSTEPTSSVFEIFSSTSAAINASGGTYIAYCFVEKKGYSKFGSYTGNGNADGTFIYTGFKPAWLMYKASSISDQSWLIHDNKRGNQGSNANPQDLRLLANATNTEADVNIDFLSNGFKTRAGDAHINSSGTTYIYMAFAESPFVNSNGIPNNAR